MQKAQASIDYLIIMALLLTVALVAVVLFGFIPDYTQSIEAKQSLDFWQQSSPVGIGQAIYNREDNKIYLAFLSRTDEPLVIKGLYINGTMLSLTTVPTNGGAGANVCGVSTCNGIPGTETKESTVSEGRTITLACSSNYYISAYVSQYGKNCPSECPVNCGSCSVGASSCSVTYNNIVCGDCKFGCSKNGYMQLTCSEGSCNCNLPLLPGSYVSASTEEFSPDGSICPPGRDYYMANVSISYLSPRDNSSIFFLDPAIQLAIDCN